MDNSRRTFLLTMFPTLAALGGCGERVELGPGIRAGAAPKQLPVEDAAGTGVLEHRGFSLTPRAEFEITGKLLSKRRYRWDALADLAPWDFAMGWDVMSDETVLAWVDITQGDRFLFRRRLHRDLPLERIERASANLHLIPADREIQEQLAAAPVGAIVYLAGLLVDAVDNAGKTRFVTSLSRNDTGAGACEILLVRSLEVRS